MPYITLGGNKQYLNKEIVEKYGLNPGMRTPLTGYKIFKDSKNEEGIASGNQEIHQTPEDGNSKLGQG